MALNPLHIRDCYAQVRNVRRILLQLSDDLGDAAITRDPDVYEQTKLLDSCSDKIADIEHELHGMQEALLQLSNGKMPTPKQAFLAAI